MSKSNWKNSIVEHGSIDPKKLIPNPENWRFHGKQQTATMDSALQEVGWISQVIVNRKTNRIVDGHMRVELAIEKGEKSIPVTYVDLTEEEERKALISFDPIASMADGTYEALLDKVSDSDLIDNLIGESQEVDGESSLKDVDVSPPPTMTWVLIGIPTVQFGSISNIVEKIAENPETIVETTYNNDES